MNKMNTPINVVGLSIITTNEAAMMQNTIGNLWGDFLKSAINEKLSNIISPSVFAVYSEYENGYQGKYRITVGFAVSNVNDIPAELTAVTIPTGNYAAFKCASNDPSDIVDTWKEIWNKDTNEFRRTFNVDFEEYNDDGVTINIGCD